MLISLIIKLAASRASQSSARIEMVIVIGSCAHCWTVQLSEVQQPCNRDRVKGMQIIVSRAFLHPKRWHYTEV